MRATIPIRHANPTTDAPTVACEDSHKPTTPTKSAMAAIRPATTFMAGNCATGAGLASTFRT